MLNCESLLDEELSRESRVREVCASLWVAPRALPLELVELLPLVEFPSMGPLEW